MQAPIGSSGSRFRHDLELLAGNDVDIDDDIYIDNATPLKLVADTSGESDGAVVIQASGGNDVTVDALGSIEVSGDDFDVLGGTSGAVTVRAGTNLSVNLTGDMTVQGGTESISTTGSGTFEKIADALVKVGNNITVNADGDLTVKGGTATARASVSDESASRRAIVNATLSADNKVDITVGGDLVVSGGLAIASAFGDDPGNRIALAEATGRIEAVSGDVVVDVAGDLKVHAGSADASAEGDNDTTGFSDSQSATAEANVEISAGRDVVIEVLGGNLEVLGPQSPLDVDADASGKFELRGERGHRRCERRHRRGSRYRQRCPHRRQLDGGEARATRPTAPMPTPPNQAAAPRSPTATPASPRSATSTSRSR